jgi:hypothetical protein
MRAATELVPERVEWRALNPPGPGSPKSSLSSVLATVLPDGGRDLEGDVAVELAVGGAADLG